MLKIKYVKFVLVTIIFSLASIIGLSNGVSAADSNYSCNLESLWNNECYLATDNVNTKLGYDQGMHFVSIVKVGNVYYFYTIRSSASEGFGVALMTTTDGVHFVDRGFVLSPDAGVTYESFPGIFYENGTFYLYTERGVFGVDIYQVTLATSTDGIHFTKQGVVLDRALGTWESGVGTPSMTKKDNTYYLFYHGGGTASDGSYKCQTGVATSSSPFGPFTKYSGNPVIPGSPVGSYDSGTTGKRDIIKEGNYYYMIYETSSIGVGGDFSGSTWTSAIARSTDLLQWEKYVQDPVLPLTNPGAPEYHGFGNDGPAFVNIDGTIWAYYRATGAVNNTKRARLANETSGGGYDRLFEAENMTHDIGSAVSDGWNANTVSHNAGYIISGPSISDIPKGEGIAIFKAKIDNNTADNANILRIEVYDATNSSVIVSREITRQQFKQANHYEFFVLPYNISTEGHSIKFRAYWYKAGSLTFDRVLIKYGDSDRIGPQNSKKYEAEGTSVGHGIGRADGDGWSANVAQDNMGFLIYGPYATDVSTGHRAVTFRMMTDNNSADKVGVVKIDVHDATTDTVLAEQVINGNFFRAPNSYQNFYLYFYNTEPGHMLEFRVIWNDVTYIKVDSISVDSLATYTFEAESAPLYHQIGRADGDGWSANTAQDNAAYLIYGPYAEYISTGTRKAVFKMMIDNNTADNSNVAKIEVYDITTNTILVEQNITRQQFTAVNTYQNFNLTFNNSVAGHALEFRTYWYDRAYIKVDKVTIN